MALRINYVRNGYVKHEMDHYFSRSSLQGRNQNMQNYSGLWGKFEK